MPDHPLEIHDIDIRTALDADTPLSRALERIRGHAAGMIPFRTSAGLRVVPAERLRAAPAMMDGDEPAGQLAGIDPSVDEMAARACLTAEPSLAGCAFGATGAGLSLVYREVAPLRCAVVMAGGVGSRLSPLTDDRPKPLLEVSGRILLFRILDLLVAHGVTRVFLSIHHLGEQVRAAVGDGGDWGIQVEYLAEDRPLDTGAGLVLLEDLDEPFFIVNGDILTDLDLTAMGRRHVLSQALVTMGTYRYPSPLRYGAIMGDGTRVAAIDEKPVYHYEINAGIYAFDPAVLGMVERGKPLAMVDFLNRQCQTAGRVHAFPIVEYWNDVGTHADFERAQNDAATLTEARQP